MRELPAGDLGHVLDRTRDAWRELSGAHLFITGASGFVGSWLLETLLHAGTRLTLGVRVTVLVRDPEAFRHHLPHLTAAPRVSLLAGDVRNFDALRGSCSHVVHCASAASPRMNTERPDEVADLIERGTARTLETAVSAGATRFLHLSSGSVYGPQPADLGHIDEAFTGTADPALAAQRFGAAKRVAERMGEACAPKVGFVSARVFGLVGPRLPLDSAFALGNFFADALAGRPVAITGDGTPVRTWMHAADLAVWCWTLLVRGRAGSAYNVGSEEECTIAVAAHRVAALARPPVGVTLAAVSAPGTNASRYVPSTRRAREAFGLDAWIPLDEALRRTWDWHTT